MAKGSLREKTPGRWELRYRGVSRTWPKDGPPNPRKRAAESALAELVTDVDKGRVLPNTGTFGELVVQWLAHANLAESTERTYKGYIKNWVTPEIGSVPLSKLTTEHIDNLLKKMRDAGKQARTVRQVHAICSGAVKQGVIWKRLPENVAKEARKPRQPRPNVDSPAPETVRAVLEAADALDPMLAAVLALSAYTGARRGELCQLRWSDIDWKARKVTITASKTDDYRTIALGPAAMATLRLHRQRMAEFGRKLARKVEPDDYLFPSTRRLGQHVNADTVTHFFKEVARSVGSDTHLHQLRHFNATQMIGAGEAVTTVSGRLGHKSTSTTLNIYAKQIAQRDQEAALAVERALTP